MTKVTAHFVEFLSPGTFFAETTTKPIAAWDTALAQTMAEEIIERHNARPYGFRFLTRGRGEEDLDSKVTARSSIYYLGGKVRTLAEVEADNLPEEKILRSNMRINGWHRVVTTDAPWCWTQPLEDGDVVLEARA